MVVYIAFDDTFIDADCANEVASGPNTVGTPIDLFEKRKLGFHTPCRVCLKDCDDFANAPTWGDRGKEVNMIFVCID